MGEDGKEGKKDGKERERGRGEGNLLASFAPQFLNHGDATDRGVCVCVFRLLSRLSTRRDWTTTTYARFIARFRY